LTRKNDASTVPHPQKTETKVKSHVGGSENDMYSRTFSRFNEKINGYWNTSMVVIKCYKHLSFNPPEKKSINQWILGFAQHFQTTPISASIFDAQPLASRTGQP
jgi:hypothetical protein